MMYSRSSRHCGMALLLLVAVAFCTLADAEALKMPAIFTDHAVLQQKAAVPVWGWGAPGEEVSVSIAGQTQTGLIREDGKWRVDLDDLTAGGPHELTVKSGNDSLTLSDILIGEE